MAKPTYYEILMVSASATTDQIRSAYRRLAREHHPDRVRDAEAKKQAEELFTGMTEAFNTLSDPERRKEYDATLRQPGTSESSAQKEAANYDRAGQVKLAERDATEAVRLFKAAIHLDSTQGTYYAHLAKALEATSALGEAARAWEDAIKREPYNGRYYRQAGECLERAGMTIRARRMYEAAAKWDKSDPTATEALRRLQEDTPKPGLLGGLFKKS